MGRLTEMYHLTDESLRQRREFIQLRDSDVRVLRRLQPWARRTAPVIAREFYNHQFAFAPTRAFFEQYAQRSGVAITDLRRRLEEAQGGYFASIFEEAKGSGEFGPTYFETRLHIGQLHNHINLPLKWYLGSYNTYLDLTRKHLRRAHPLQAGLRARAERALFVVFNYDMQAVCDAFFYDYLQSIGLDLAQIRVERGDHDLSEYYGALKQAVSDTLIGATRASVQLQEISGQLRDVTAQNRDAVAQVTTTVQQLAMGASHQAGSLDQTVAEVVQLQGHAEHVSGVVDQIREIAERVDLLALNAAIEAARAGAAGRGFAIVAEEVRKLAENTASLVVQIDRSVKEMTTSMERATEAISAVAAVGQETAASAEEISAAAEELNAQIDETASQASQVAIVTDDLAGMVARFTFEGNERQQGRPPRLRRVA